MDVNGRLSDIYIYIYIYIYNMQHSIYIRSTPYNYYIMEIFSTFDTDGTPANE